MIEELIEFLKILREEREQRMYEQMLGCYCFDFMRFDSPFCRKKDPETLKREWEREREELLALIDRLEAEEAAERAKGRDTETKRGWNRKGWCKKAAAGKLQ